MPRSTLLILLTLAACGDHPQPASSPPRDLTAASEQQPQRAEVETATRRADSQFNTCLFVYDTEERLRECLVLRSGWSTAAAQRAIDKYKARVRQVADSVQVERERQAREAAATLAATAKAQRRHRDSVYLATHKERLDGPVTEIDANSPPWMVDTRTGAYYRSTCDAAALIPVGAREFIGYQADAAKDHWPSRQRGCQ